jgi:alkanesulfonate monooxygenase SsuD/methylene tetrahydromethanopterin reductase-like flavin-dependent oxidoreductase (luciferase family)
MTLIGYTMMCEQAGPKQLVRDAALAEEAGFDFAVISDHYSRGCRPRATPRTHGGCGARS